MSTDPAHGHDLVAHLYLTALGLMRRHRQPFLPLEVVHEQLGWPDEVLDAVVDHCVEQTPVASGLVAEWMHDGQRRAYGQARVRFIGIRPAEAAGSGAS